MKITNQKEYDEAYTRRERLQTKIDELYAQLIPLQYDFNQLDGEIEDYDNEQRALDE